MNFEIRAFCTGDSDALLGVFDRAGEGAPTSSLWGDVESEAAIYLEPYVTGEPESVLVAVVDGDLVGYLTGCLDSSTFPSESERIDRAIKRYRLWRRRRTVAFFARATFDTVIDKLLRRDIAGDFDDPWWPSHLHINVLPAVRGTGLAEALMCRWQEQLTDAGSPGCHLQTLVENERAVAFFTRMGFREHGPTPPVPGLRHQGRRVHQRTMVWSLDPEPKPDAG